MGRSASLHQLGNDLRNLAQDLNKALYAYLNSGGNFGNYKSASRRFHTAVLNAANSIPDIHQVIVSEEYYTDGEVPGEKYIKNLILRAWVSDGDSDDKQAEQEDKDKTDFSSSSSSSLVAWP